MDRAEKAEAVEVLKGIFASAGVVVVSHYAGLTVAEMTAFRRRLRPAEAGLKVIKNRLAKIALEGTPGYAGADLFTGPAAIVYARDPVAGAKLALDYSKENQKFVLLGAILGGAVLDPEGVKALSTMPSIEEMRAKLLGALNAPAAKFLGTLNAPASKFVGTLAAPGGKLAGVLKAYQQKLESQAA